MYETYQYDSGHHAKRLKSKNVKLPKYNIDPPGLHRYVKEFDGKKFGRLEVLKFSHLDENHIYWWTCICECGKITDVRSAHLRTGQTKSCGCSRRTRDPKTGRPLSRQEIYATRLYREHCAAATKNNIKNDLTQDQYILIIQGRCHFCHRPPYRRKSRKINAFAHIGVDRLDRNGDFTVTNTVACCRWCKAKN